MTICLKKSWLFGFPCVSFVYVCICVCALLGLDVGFGLLIPDHGLSFTFNCQIVWLNL